MTKSNTTQLLMQVIEVWVMILQAVPSSRFLLKNKPFACPAAREHVMQLFVRKGIAAHRIDLLPLAVANAGTSSSAFQSNTMQRVGDILQNHFCRQGWFILRSTCHGSLMLA